ncbi:hypothetical protein A8A54_23000 [Brucella pseudogrignonensis]|nr:hypothetical protein A8A54_23000 [Brucella pseudogrignonensis]
MAETYNAVATWDPPSHREVRFFHTNSYKGQRASTPGSGDGGDKARGDFHACPLSGSVQKGLKVTRAVQDAQHFDAFCIVREEDEIAVMARDAQTLSEVRSRWEAFRAHRNCAKDERFECRDKG